MSVYLDSVFCPLLRERDFLQEGWRLENEDILDKDSEFVVKGENFFIGRYLKLMSLNEGLT